jgi:hypothetical protein
MFINESELKRKNSEMLRKRYRLYLSVLNSWNERRKRKK